MTPNKEDYLKTIFDESTPEQLVSNKVLAEKMGVSPASVTEMLVKLRNEGLIHYEAYKGSRLTDKGFQSCVHVVRGHRLWEVFLTRYLGYSWSEAHEDAHLLEHVTPERMIRRLDQFLKHPAYCPHGSAIPEPDGTVRARELFPLSQASPDARIYIRRVQEEKELLDYLQATGLKIGEPATVKEVGVYEGPITLQYEGQTLQLSYKAASRIFVEQVTEVEE